MCTFKQHTKLLPRISLPAALSRGRPAQPPGQPPRRAFSMPSARTARQYASCPVLTLLETHVEWHKEVRWASRLEDGTSAVLACHSSTCAPGALTPPPACRLGPLLQGWTPEDTLEQTLRESAQYLPVLELLLAAGYRPTVYENVPVSYGSGPPVLAPRFDPIKEDPALDLDGCNQ